MGLFAESMEELREKFVRNRFAESQHFENPDIEAWLKNQTVAEFPDLNRWSCMNAGYLGQTGNQNGLVEALRDGVEQCEMISLVPSSTDQHDSIYTELLKTLISSLSVETELYQGPNGPVMAHGKAGGPVRLFALVYSEGRGEVKLERVTWSVMKPMLLSSWQNSESKRAIARQLLCNKATAAVTRVRAEAEKDFGEAVAVNTDATKIWHADEVIVLGENTHADLSISPQRFKERKIFLDIDCRFESSCYYNVVKHAESVRKSNQQTLVRFSDDVSVITILFTPRRYCPDPLPEGGALINP